LGHWSSDRELIRQALVSAPHIREMPPSTGYLYFRTRATMPGAPWVSVAFVACLIVASVNANGFSTQYKGHTQHPTIPEHCLYEELDLAVPLHGYLLPTGHQDYCIRLECTDDYLLLIRQ